MVRFWSLEPSEPKAKPAAPAQQQQQQPAAIPINGDVYALAFSPNGKTLGVAQSDSKATASVPGSVEMINVSVRQVVARVNGHLGGVRALAFSRDGKAFATGRH